MSSWTSASALTFTFSRGSARPAEAEAEAGPCPKAPTMPEMHASLLDSQSSSSRNAVAKVAAEVKGSQKEILLRKDQWVSAEQVHSIMRDSSVRLLMSDAAASHNRG